MALIHLGVFGFGCGLQRAESAQAPELVVELKEEVLVRGTVLLNGQPVRGAQVTISRSEPADERGVFRSIPLATVETDEDGVYSATVERASKYTVLVNSIPGERARPMQATGAQPFKSNVVDVSPFNFQTGTEEIHGVVLDANRRPLAGVVISIRPKPQPGLNPILLRSARQLTTDQQGKFLLESLPKGEYQISARPQQIGQGRILTATVDAATGDKDVKIIVETNEEPSLPRLQVQSITDY